MTALLMKQVLGFVIGPIKIFSDFNGYFYGHVLSADFICTSMIFPSFLNDLKIQKGRQEANDSGLKDRRETKKCPMGEYPKGQAVTGIFFCYGLKKGRNYPLKGLSFL